MKTGEIKEKIKQFIADHFIQADNSINLGDDDSLLDKQIIDSTGVLELVAYIEETYNIRVEDEELIPENLDSLNKIQTYIQYKIKK
jgi:acyl carrier protein